MATIQFRGRQPQARENLIRFAEMFALTVRIERFLTRVMLHHFVHLRVMAAPAQLGKMITQLVSPHLLCQMLESLFKFFVHTLTDGNR